jgi:hypothetical protein
LKISPGAAKVRPTLNPLVQPFVKELVQVAVVWRSIFNEWDCSVSLSFRKTDLKMTCDFGCTFPTREYFGFSGTNETVDQLISILIGFEKGFSIENAKETSEQKTLTWAAEDNLTVKPNSTLTAELQIREKQCSYTFSSKVAINGRVTVSIYNRQENNNFIMFPLNNM